MYTQCVATGNCAPPAQEVGSPVYSNPLYGDFPVVGVTWDMAANYCGWAQAQLPTEAQWEKAARGADGAVYPWGLADPSCSVVNSEGCLGHSSSVLDFPDGRSPYGAYDMAGNVFQWVKDFYDEHAYDSMAARNPTGPASGSSHVLRGSSYETEKALLSSAVRHFGASAYHSSELGFRCAVAAAQRHWLRTASSIRMCQQAQALQTTRANSHSWERRIPTVLGARASPRSPSRMRRHTALRRPATIAAMPL